MVDLYNTFVPVSIQAHYVIKNKLIITKKITSLLNYYFLVHHSLLPDLPFDIT